MRKMQRATRGVYRHHKPASRNADWNGLRSQWTVRFIMCERGVVVYGHCGLLHWCMYIEGDASFAACREMDLLRAGKVLAKVMSDVIILVKR